MKKRSLLAFLAIASLAACGGGGGSGSSIAPGTGGATPGNGSINVPATAPPAAPAGSLKATLSIVIPTAGGVSSALSRRAQTVAVGTQSITMTLLKSNGTVVTTAPQGPFPLTATSPGCTATSGSVTCRIQIDAPIGADIFSAQTYSTTTASAGTLLGSGAVALTIAENAINTANLTLNGPVASVVLASAGSYLGNGISQIPSSVRRSTSVLQPSLPFVASLPLYVIALDATGNVIINPAIYNTPITLQLSLNNDSPAVSLNVTYAANDGAASPSATTRVEGGAIDVLSPSDVVTANLITTVPRSSDVNITAYVGNAPASPLLYPSPAPNILDIAVNNGGLQALPSSLSFNGGSDNGIYPLEAGYSGGFTVDATACAGIVTVGPYRGQYINPYGYGFGVTPIGGGSCSLVLHDSNGNSVTVPVTSTTLAVTGS